MEAGLQAAVSPGLVYCTMSVYIQPTPPSHWNRRTRTDGCICDPPRPHESPEAMRINQDILTTPLSKQALRWPRKKEWHTSRSPVPLFRKGSCEWTCVHTQCARPSTLRPARLGEYARVRKGARNPLLVTAMPTPSNAEPLDPYTSTQGPLRTV
jgi:hypothetical protein